MNKFIGASALVYSEIEEKYVFEISKSKHWQSDDDGKIVIGIGCIGGGIEADETPYDALVREGKEEINTLLMVEKSNQPFSVTHNNEVFVNEPNEYPEDCLFCWESSYEDQSGNYICVYSCRAGTDLIPGDVAGVVYLDLNQIDLLINERCSFDRLIGEGVKFDLNIDLPSGALFQPTGTFWKIQELRKKRYPGVKRFFRHGMPAKHSNIPAAYLILIQDDQVLMLRRHNTGYEDGNYSFIAGHVEKGETFTQCVIREAQEEAGITVKPEGLKVVHCMHRNSGLSEDNERVDLFLMAQRWEGEIVNREPEKCDDLSWFSLDGLPENTIPYIRHALECVKKKIYYSEFGWR